MCGQYGFACNRSAQPTLLSKTEPSSLPYVIIALMESVGSQTVFI